MNFDKIQEVLKACCSSIYTDFSDSAGLNTQKNLRDCHHL